MTPNELKAAGWERPRPEIAEWRRNGSFMYGRDDGRGKGRVSVASHPFGEINGPWLPHFPSKTRPEEAMLPLLRALGACAMPDGRTVREWALSPAVTP